LTEHLYSRVRDVRIANFATLRNIRVLVEAWMTFRKNAQTNGIVRRGVDFFAKPVRVRFVLLQRAPTRVFPKMDIHIISKLVVPSMLRQNHKQFLDRQDIVDATVAWRSHMEVLPIDSECTGHYANRF
jgi:hypothetical protein